MLTKVVPSSRYYKGNRYTQVLAYHTASPELAHVPIHGGVNIRHAGAGGGGSIGIVRKGTKPYLISNKHVFADTYASGFSKANVTAAQYLKMVEAARLTKATPITSGGRVVARTVPAMQNRTMDVAFAEPTVAVSWEVPGVGMQKGSVQPSVGMKVTTVGSTTGQNFGTVKYLSLLSSDNYIAEFPGAGAASGDSGSPLFEVGTGRVAGLVRGQGKSGNTPVIEFISAPAIERAFGVSFASGTTTPAPSPTTPTPTPTPTPTTPRPSTPPVADNPLAALIQLIMDFINDILATLRG